MFLIVIMSEQTNLMLGLNLQYNIRLHDKNHNIHRNTTLQCPDNTTPIHHNRTKHNSYCWTNLQFIRLRQHSTSWRRSYRIHDAIFVPNRHIPSFQREQIMPAQRQVAQYAFTQAYPGPRTKGEVSCDRMAGWSLTRFFQWHDILGISATHETVRMPSCSEISIRARREPWAICNTLEGRPWLRLVTWPPVPKSARGFEIHEECHSKK